MKPCTDDWPAEGHSDDAGTSVGGEVALKAEGLQAFQELFAKRAFFGEKQAVASFRGVVAIGMSSGVLLVLMPRGLNAQGAPTGYVLRPGSSRIPLVKPSSRLFLSEFGGLGWLSSSLDTSGWQTATFTQTPRATIMRQACLELSCQAPGPAHP